MTLFIPYVNYESKCAKHAPHPCDCQPPLSNKERVERRRRIISARGKMAAKVKE